MTAVLIGSLLQAGCGGARRNRGAPLSSAGPPSPYADYPALLRRGPSGIGLVTAAQARAAAITGTRPLWVSQRSEARGMGSSSVPAVPIISSAREVARTGRARLWIARSSQGGVCVLSFRPELALDASRYHAVSASCASAGRLATGAAQIERAGDGGRWLVSGVAPREVATVTLRLAGGSERTVPVTDNAYSAAVERPVEGLAFATGGMRHKQPETGGAR
jgi:hypothetical protein